MNFVLASWKQDGKCGIDWIHLDTVGQREVQQAYGTLSNQFHESAHNHLENDHSTLYKIRSIICKRVMEVARKTEKNKRGEGTELRHASLQVDTFTVSSV